MASDARHAAWAALAQRNLPQQALTALLRELGDPGAVLGAGRQRLAHIVAPAVVDRLLAPPDAERLATTLAWLASEHHSLIAWDDDDYPRALFEGADAPPALFYVGRRELLNRPR